VNARTARVITASNRAAAGVYADRGGPVIVAWLRERGYECRSPRWCRTAIRSVTRCAPPWPTARTW
jgi:molybdopterin biosynthesis enzyme MoaB